MVQVTDSDSLLSFLTMAHIFGRVTEEFALSCGAAIGYWQARFFSSQAAPMGVV